MASKNYNLNLANKESLSFDFIDALRGYAILLVILVHSTASVAPLEKL